MHEHEPHTHTTTTETEGGMASGMLLGIVLVLLVLAVAAFVFFGNAFQGSTPAQPAERDTNIQINPPKPGVDVDVKPGQQNGGTQQSPAQPSPKP